MPSKQNNKLPQVSKETSVTKKPFVKASNAEIEIRVNQIIHFLIVGKTRGFILRHFAETENVSERTVDYYIERAWEDIKESNRGTLDSKLAKITRALIKNYEMAITADAPDLGEARQSIMALAKLQGLDQQNIHLTVEKVDPEIDKMSDDDLTLMLGEDD